MNDYRPTVDQVAALIPNRTRDANGNLLNTFTDDGKTTPTSTQVGAKIDQAMNEAYPVFGDPGAFPDSPGSDPDALRKAAAAVVAARAAIWVERGYFQHDIDSNVLMGFQRDWETGLTRVGKGMSEITLGETVGRSDDQVTAIGEFPDDPYVSGKLW
jgi:hypothetical protein